MIEMIDLQTAFAVFSARKLRRMVFVDKSGGVHLDIPSEFVSVAMPTGEILDAIPLSVGEVDRVSCGLALC